MLETLCVLIWLENIYFLQGKFAVNVRQYKRRRTHWWMQYFENKVSTALARQHESL